MKKCLLFYILLSAFSFVPAQEFFPKHFGYELTILPSEEKEIKLENVSFVAINERFTLFDFYKNKVDSIPMSFEAKIMSIIEKYNLLKVDRYAYRKSKKGNPLYEAESHIWVGYNNDYLKNTIVVNAEDNPDMNKKIIENILNNKEGYLEKYLEMLKTGAKVRKYRCT